MYARNNMAKSACLFRTGTSGLTWFFLWFLLFLHRELQADDEAHVLLVVGLHQFWQQGEETNGHSLRGLKVEKE